MWVKFQQSFHWSLDVSVDILISSVAQSDEFHYSNKKPAIVGSDRESTEALWSDQGDILEQVSCDEILSEPDDVEFGWFVGGRHAIRGPVRSAAEHIRRWICAHQQA